MRPPRLLERRVLNRWQGRKTAFVQVGYGFLRFFSKTRPG